MPPPTTQAPCPQEADEWTEARRTEGHSIHFYPVYLFIPHTFLYKNCGGFQELLGINWKQNHVARDSHVRAARNDQFPQTCEKGPMRLAEAEDCVCCELPGRQRKKENRLSLPFKTTTSSSNSQVKDPFRTLKGALRRPQTPSFKPCQTKTSPRQGTEQPEVQG